LPDPADRILIDAVLDGMKQRVVFLVDADADEPEEIDRLGRKTEKLALTALTEQFGKDAAKKFFVSSENPWLLRTKFGGWVFFYPIDVLTEQTSWDELGSPNFVYWPDTQGKYGRIPWSQWLDMRGRGNVWRPSSPSRTVTGPRSIWERLRDP
jgi:hypothetical protein